jgi:hypothetical protein
MNIRSLRFYVAALATLCLCSHAVALEWDNNSGTSGAQGGSGTWNYTSTNWWNGSGDVAFTSGSAAILGGTSGSITMGTSVVAGSLAVNTTGYSITTGSSSTLTINGGVTGQNFTNYDHLGGIIFKSDAYFGGTLAPINTSSKTTITADGATVTFDGRWDDGLSGNSAYARLKNGGDFYIGPNASINNNMYDMINARPFYVLGDGTGNTFEFDAGFNADHTEYGTSNWHADGLSTFRIGSATLITNATQNIPSIHKKAGNGQHTHHGLIIFDQDNNARWRVQTSNQACDAGVNWSKNWVLETVTDLEFNGHYDPVLHHVAFGNIGSTPTTVTKEGPGGLILNGTQLYSQGTTMNVTAGRVDFLTNPGAPAPSGYLGWPAANPGAYLQLLVGSGAVANFNATQNQIAVLASSGSVNIGAGSADVLGTTTLSAGSSMTLSSGSTSAVYLHTLDIQTGALLNLNGRTVNFDNGGAMKRLYEGDANVSGGVDVTDLGILATNYGVATGRSWRTGDFNGDGRVDVTDLGLLATNYGSGAVNIDAVPEPTSVLMLVLGMVSLLNNRKNPI